MQRRDFIQKCIPLTGAAALAASQGALALGTSGAAGQHTRKKVIWVMLRGAMDSLHAVVPLKEPRLGEYRGELLRPIADKLNPLDHQFALHPALQNLHRWYRDKQMSPIVAVASPYRERSHFDAQGMLESGLAETDHNSGWLARAFAQMQTRADSAEALSVATALPISMRGEATVRSWYPSFLPDARSGFYHSLAQLYDNEPQLLKDLQEGLGTRDMLDMQKQKKRKPQFTRLASSLGRLLRQNPDICCAMMDLDGWDTHNNQANRLHRGFAELDKGLGKLRDELGKVWDDTTIIVATEFGRTVRSNGTKGTDHGTASAAFLLGGAVRGGRVLGEWPGLEPEQLYENRDLNPTSDLRSWMATLLAQHWGLSPAQLARVFPQVSVRQTRLV